MYQPTFKFVEHYLEFIGGFRSRDGIKLFLFDTVDPPISLARYDVKVINSMCVQTSEMQKALTDRQAELAVKLIEKYKRQLANLNPSVILPERLDCFELGIRQVDRTKMAWLNNGVISVKFPYEVNLIGMVRKLTSEGQGAAEFDITKKIWHLQLTEYMINWVMSVLPKYNFVIDPQIEQIYNKILDIEKQNYRIVLEKHDHGLVLNNADSCLLDYIDTHIGGLKQENLLKLVDYSSVLGYEVDELLVESALTSYQRFMPMIKARYIELSLTEFSVDNIIEYAKLTNRLPIYFYDTSVTRPDTEYIVYINKKAPDNLEAKLLVTKTPMMIGSKKQSWLVSAEKTIVLV